MYPPKETEPSTIFIDGRGRFQLGNVREEALELVYVLKRISVSGLTQAVSEGDTKPHQLVPPLVLRNTIGPHILSYQTRQAWLRRQARVEGFLDLMGIKPELSPTFPEQVAQALKTMHLLFKYPDIITFWGKMNSNLVNLHEQGVHGLITTTDLARTVDASSIIMRTALYIGVYRLGRSSETAQNLQTAA